MEPKKYDSFTPKRTANIDGFFARPVENRPRKPVFRASTAELQPTPDTLSDMPKRAQPQSVLATATAAPVATSSPVPFPLEGDGRRRSVKTDLPEEPRKRGAKRKGRASKNESPRTKKRFWKRTGIIVGILVILVGGWFGARFYKDIARLTGNNNPLSLLSAFHPVALKNDDGRVNILVAGNSADDLGHNGGTLTDSIMVLSIDTKKNTAMMLSIPRDLWVENASGGHSKINAIYPDGGMDALQDVVEEDLGLPIHYQVLVNYTAFKDLVNAVGGITITIKSDDSRGIYDPSLDYTSRHCCALAKYPNGPVTLNGTQALNLARARGDAYGSYGFPQADFDRTEHQRQMLMAIKTKASSTAVIANPLKVASLIDAVGNNVKTNLKVNEIETLYTYMKKIDNGKIDSYNINTLKGKGTTMLENYTSPDGQSALVPAAGPDDFTDIQKQIQKLFTADAVVKEGATVLVLNGTDQAGLAAQQKNKLIGKGLTVFVNDAPATQPTTTVIDNSGGSMPNTLAYLKSAYKASVVSNSALVAAHPTADFIIILGQSAVPKTSTSASQ